MATLDDWLKQLKVTNVLLEAIGEAKKGLSGWRSERARHRRTRRMGAEIRRERRQRVLRPVLEPKECGTNSGSSQREEETDGNVMAGMARTGDVYPLNIDPEVLMRAFQNTVTLLKSNVRVAQEETNVVR